MAKFRFNLERVLNHRKTQEEVAQRDFQEALSGLNLEKEILAQLELEKHQAFRNRFQIQVQGGAAGDTLFQVHQYLQGQDLRIERQKQKILDVEKQVEELREILRLKVIETKIMEELREKRRLEFVQEEAKKEQKRIDDLNNTRFVRKKE